MSIWDSIRNTPINPLYMYTRDDPQAAANKFLSKIPGMGEKYYNPYLERGNTAGNVLGNEYGKMLNPTSFIDDIMKNYSTSKAAEYERDKLGREIGATAAAGGFAGTPEHQRQYGEMADRIMSGDMQQYLQNALNVYGTGLTGQQDFFNKGFEATGSLADLLGGSLSSQGTLAFKSASDRNADRQALMNALAKLLSQGTGVYAGS